MILPTLMSSLEGTNSSSPPPPPPDDAPFAAASDQIKTQITLQQPLSEFILILLGSKVFINTD